MLLAAWRGSEAETSDMVHRCRSEAQTRGLGERLSHSEYAEAVLYNGLGRYRDALDVLEGWSGRDELSANWILPELVEAAVRSGEADRATAAVERLVPRTRANGSDWALGIQSRTLALVASGQAAERLHREAIERLEQCRVITDRARAHLLYGEWLRRERRRVDARRELHIAADLFSSMGAAAFAGRAHRELLATGERARKRSAETICQLTPREEEIARLAADGRSNPQIATELFISARTVEYHLHKVFTKLGISSRLQLGSWSTSGRASA
jgi:DNA-binding CsgD family transcriptional regulator